MNNQPETIIEYLKITFLKVIVELMKIPCGNYIAAQQQLDLKITARMRWIQATNQITTLEQLAVTANRKW